MKRLIPLIAGLFILGHLAAQPAFIASQESVFDQTTVCVDITTKDFTDLLMVEYTMNWDSDLLTYSHVENLDLEGLAFEDFNETAIDQGLLGLSWGDTLDQIGLTFPDDTRLFSVCFSIASLCESTSIQFTDELNPIFDHKDLEKKYLFKQLYPTLPYNENKLNNLISDLLQLLYSFLAYQRLEQQPTLEKQLLLEELLQREAFRHVDKNARRLKQHLEKLPERSYAYYQANFQYYDQLDYYELSRADIRLLSLFSL